MQFTRKNHLPITCFTILLFLCFAAGGFRGTVFASGIVTAEEPEYAPDNMPVKLILEPWISKIKVGQKGQMQAYYVYADVAKVTAEDVIYTSTVPEALSVDERTGEITALAVAQDIVIHAESRDGRYKASAVVSVLPVSAEEIVLNATEVKNLKIGDKFKLTAGILPVEASSQNVKFRVAGKQKPLDSSISSTVLSVNAKTGTVTIKGLGEATVEAVSEDGACKAQCKFKVRQTYFNVVKLGADGTDKSRDTPALKNALKWAVSVDEPITVYVPAGTYYIDSTLYIYSDTKLILDDKAVIKRKSSSQSITMLQSRYKKKETKGYSQCSNVEITGGTWNGNANGKGCADNIYIGHAKNIKIHDTAVINNSGCHLIEFAGVKDSSIKDVKLDGFKICTQKGYALGDQSVKEAIQLDYCSAASAKTMAPHDNTVCENITIENCRISNYMCGIGAHGCVSGVYLKNIKIKNNTFKNITNCCIDLRNFKKVTISGNKASAFQTFLYAFSSTGTVKKNNLTNKAFKRKTGQGLMYSNGIYLSSGSDFDILGNTVCNCGYNGISVASGSYASISSNTIKNNSQYGIKVTGAKAAISGNDVEDNKKTRQYYADSGAAVQCDDIRGYYVPLDKKYAYTGKPVRPEIKIAGLSRGEDYKVSYKKNKKPGKAQVIITGKGAKKGKLVLTFRIVEEKSSES